jgi:hypothetical protein
MRFLAVFLSLVVGSASAQSIGPDGRVLPAYSGGRSTVTAPRPTPPTPVPAPTPPPGTIITTTVALAPLTRGQGHVVPDGTEVDLKLAESISSARAMVGQRIRFTVAKDVVSDGYVVIPTGALAIGTITKASPKKWAGRSGKLEMSLQDVTAIDGTKIDLAGSRGGSGDSHVGRMVTGMVITSIISLGGASLFLLMHGKDIVIPEGSDATTFTIGTATVASSQPMVASVN